MSSSSMVARTATHSPLSRPTFAAAASSSFDEAERSVGISAFVSPNTPGFAAVSKARYSDFVVHEVDVEGNIARLESLEDNLKETEVAEEEKSNTDTDKNTVDGDDMSKKRSVEDSTLALEQSSVKKLKTEGDACGNGTNTANKEADKMSNDDKLSEAEKELTKLVGEEAAKGAIKMLRLWEGEIGDEKVEKNFTLPFIDDKDKRRSIHQLIRSDLLVPFALADTVEKKVRIWHKRFEKEMPNYGHFPRRGDGRGRGGQGRENRQAKWPSDRPNYLRFVLYKENIDTGTAVKELSRMLRSGKGGRHGRGGRGGAGRGRGGRNDSATINYAGMKDKRGVTAQFCTVYRGTPGDLLKINGIPSSQGSGCGGTSTRGAALIKVGHFSYVGDSMGLGSLGGNRFDIVLRNAWVDESKNGERIEATKAALEQAARTFQENGFINYFGMQRFGRYYDTHITGREVIKGNFEEVVSIIMRPKGDENDRYTDARRRWENRFNGIDMNDEKAVLEAEKKCAQSVLRDLGRFMNCEASLMNSLSRRPRDYKRAFQSIAKNMRSMFVHGFQSYLWNCAASHRIEAGGHEHVMVGDLVLVEDKSLLEGGSGTSGLKGKTVKVLTEEDVKGGQYTITDVVLPMAGSKIQYPENSTGNYFDEMLAENGITKDSLKKFPDREISLTGDYRRLLCRPSDITFEVKTYDDPLQPLLQTDLMKISDVKSPPADSSAEDGSNRDPSDDTQKGNAEIDEGDSEAGAPLIGLVVGFTLPPSSYATVALRELMKTPTSSDYQRQLQLSGNCERSVVGKTEASDTKANENEVAGGD